MLCHAKNHPFICACSETRTGHNHENNNSWNYNNNKGKSDDRMSPMQKKGKQRRRPNDAPKRMNSILNSVWEGYIRSTFMRKPEHEYYRKEVLNPWCAMKWSCKWSSNDWALCVRRNTHAKNIHVWCIGALVVNCVSSWILNYRHDGARWTCSRYAMREWIRVGTRDGRANSKKNAVKRNPIVLFENLIFSLWHYC